MDIAIEDLDAIERTLRRYNDIVKLRTDASVPKVIAYWVDLLESLPAERHNEARRRILDVATAHQHYHELRREAEDWLLGLLEGEPPAGIAISLDELLGAVSWGEPTMQAQLDYMRSMIVVRLNAETEA